MILIRSIVLLASSLTAQTPADSTRAVGRDRPGIYIGPFVGGVSAELSGLSNLYVTHHSRLDFSTGVQWDRVFESGAFLRSGVFYAGRGGATSASSIDVDVVARYVEFPLLVGYRLPDAVGTRVFVMGGPQLGIQASCKYEGQAFGMNVNLNCDDGETFDLAVLAGGGISIALGRANLLFDFRLMQGLRDVEAGSGSKNRGVTIGAGYMFALGHRE